MRISDWSSDVFSSDLRGAMIAFGRSVGSKVLMLGASLYLLADAFQQSIVTTPTAWLWPKIALGILVISCMIGILQDLASKPWLHETISATEQIGRASCRERVCQYVEISVVAVSLKK